MLARIRERAAAELAELTELEARLEAMEVPEGFGEVMAYQRATLDYGIAAGRHALEWFTEFAGRDDSSAQ